MYKKLLLAPVVAIVFLFVLGIVSYRGIGEQKAIVQELFENRFQMYQDSARIMGDIKSVHANVYQVLTLSSINADAKQVDALGKQQVLTLEENVKLIEGLLKKNLTPEERKTYQDCRQLIADYRDTVAKVVDMAMADYNVAASMMKPAIAKFQNLNQSLQGLMDLEAKLGRQKYDDALTSFRATLVTFVLVFVSAILLSVLTSAFMTRFLLSTIRKVNEVVGMIAEGDLTRGLEIQARDEMGQLARSVEVMRSKVEDLVGKSMAISHSLAESASEQAAALEETSASLNQTASMTQQNADHTQQANQLMNDGSKAADDASGSMQDLTRSMNEIAEASMQAQKIVKSIDEIAFQTNLLALNAAVEAARAGEAGAGFAVVAGEVRNLAIRATEAAKGTTGLIEEIISRVRTGENRVKSTNELFHAVHGTSQQVRQLMGSIADASQEQAEGIGQINRAMEDMNRVTQRNASLSEELSATISLFKTRQIEA
jgi:methyl-accepting chemotaxis protein